MDEGAPVLIALAITTVALAAGIAVIRRQAARARNERWEIRLLRQIAALPETPEPAIAKETP